MEKQGQTESYRMIAAECCGEIVEKKSRFIAVLTPVKTQEEALDFLDGIRKKYYDARHHCYAFITGINGELERWGDDGEPGGTAGRPMLDVLRGAELTNVAAVVTRYFGGTLLGTGGLARAYAQAVRQALETCHIVTMRCGQRYVITADYGLTGKLQHLFAQRKVTIEETVYTDKVEFHILAPYHMQAGLRKEITELTGAKAGIEERESAWYADRG